MNRNLVSFKHWLLIPLLALGLFGCSYHDAPEANMNQPGRALTPGQVTFNYSGDGFLVEVIHDMDNRDHATINVYADWLALDDVGHKLTISLGEKLANAAIVDLTVKDINGDIGLKPETVSGFQRNTAFFIDLDPRMYKLEQEYGLKFSIQIDNQGHDMNGSSLFKRMIGGHVIAENLDGRSLETSPHMTESDQGMEEGGGPGNLGGVTHGTLKGGGGNDDGDGELDNNGSLGVQAPIMNNPSGHVVVENLDGRSPTRLRHTFRLND